MIIREDLSVDEKLAILSDAAKYDAACTSSGVDRSGVSGSIGNSKSCGICHTFTSDGRCISLLKILFTNECIFDCAYCVNRSSNNTLRTAFTPREVADLTIGFYKRNYIEGLFLSSGVMRTPDYTMEQIIRTLMILRDEYGFNGYIHCKAIPGASKEYVELAGWYADRMSVNLELPTAEGLRTLAPHKNRKNILLPMRQIQSGIEESRQALGMKGGNYSAYQYTKQTAGIGTAGKIGAVSNNSTYQYNKKMTGSTAAGSSMNDRLRKQFEKASLHKITEEAGNCIFSNDGIAADDNTHNIKSDTVTAHSIKPDNPDTAFEVHSKKITSEDNSADNVPGSIFSGIDIGRKYKAEGLGMLGNKSLTRRGFAPGGQSTQMIIGASGESDYQIMSVSEALYSRFDLKRVFYSAFIRVNDDSRLPVLEQGVPLLREHRLYQADWLLRYYGFDTSELLSEDRPNFNVFLDPKCDWAVRNLDKFPIEVSNADYYTLLRVPGIGVRSASRIMKIRRNTRLDFNILKKTGVVLKRAAYFITCNGALYCPVKFNEDFITKALMSNKDKDMGIKNMTDGFSYSQISLFDDKNFVKANSEGIMLTGI